MLLQIINSKKEQINSLEVLTDFANKSKLLNKTLYVKGSIDATEKILIGLLEQNGFVILKDKSKSLLEKINSTFNKLSKIKGISEFYAKTSNIMDLVEQCNYLEEQSLLCSNALKFINLKVVVSVNKVQVNELLGLYSELEKKELEQQIKLLESSLETESDNLE